MSTTRQVCEFEISTLILWSTAVSDGQKRFGRDFCFNLKPLRFNDDTRHKMVQLRSILTEDKEQ